MTKENYQIVFRISLCMFLFTSIFSEKCGSSGWLEYSCGDFPTIENGQIIFLNKCCKMNGTWYCVVDTRYHPCEEVVTTTTQPSAGTTYKSSITTIQPSAGTSYKPLTTTSRPSAGPIPPAHTTYRPSTWSFGNSQSSIVESSSTINVGVAVGASVGFVVLVVIVLVIIFVIRRQHLDKNGPKTVTRYPPNLDSQTQAVSRTAYMQGPSYGNIATVPNRNPVLYNQQTGIIQNGQHPNFSVHFLPLNTNGSVNTGFQQNTPSSTINKPSSHFNYTKKEDPRCNTNYEATINPPPYSESHLYTDITTTTEANSLTHL